MQTAEEEEATAMPAISDSELREVASDYAAYLGVDMDGELKGIYESVEEMQLRLEEFSSMLGMLQANSSKSIADNVPRAHALQPHVSEFCRRVDGLEAFVARASADLANLEANVDAAEASRGTADKLGILNPLSYFKKSTEPAVSSAPQVAPQTPNVFKTEDYFDTADSAE